MAVHNLEELAAMLARTDRQIIDLLTIRLRLAREVEEAKHATGQAIVRLDVEDQRIAQVAEWARENGINPHFAEAILYSVIGESCKEQLRQRQARHAVISEEDEEARYRNLKQSLLALTAAIAPIYDERYIRRHSALHAYLRFERSFIRNVLAAIDNRLFALDLGCATGHKAFRLGRSDFGNFREVAGYDISPEMIQIAEEKARASSSDHIRFSVQDLDQGIPERNNSASFVLLNMGTASDIRDIRTLIKEIGRVLVPGGRAVLSFYNREALLYQAGFLPWSTGLAAEIDLKRNCLSVQGPKGKIFPVYARPYTVSEVRELFSGNLILRDLQTYPTMSSILPNMIFENDPIRALLREVDERLSEEALGTYILVSAEK